MRQSPWRLAAVAMAGVAVIASAGCGKRSVATVKGVKITREEFYKRLEQFPTVPTAGMIPNIQQQAATTVLGQLIANQMIVQLAKENGVEVTREMLDVRKRELNGALLDRDQDKDLNMFLTQAGWSHKDLDDRLTPELARYELMSKFLKLDPKKVDAAYKQATTMPEPMRFRSRFFLPEQRKVEVIITTSQAKINEAKQQLDKGVTFAVVAEQFSIDENTRSKKGEVGWIPKPDPIRPPMQGVPQAVYQRVFATPAGKIAGPFQAAPNQFIILRVKDLRPARMQPFDHVKGVIRDLLLEQELQMAKDDNEGANKLKKLFEKLAKDAPTDVKVTLPTYDKVMGDLLKSIAKQASTTSSSVTPRPGQ